MSSALEQSIRQFRRLRAQREATTARALRAAFETARNALQTQLDSMTAWMEANPDPPLWRVLAEARTRNLLEQTERLFAQYSREVGDTVIREQQQAVAQAQMDARQLIERGFGPPPIGVGMPFVRIPQQAITQLVATTQPGAPVRKLLDEFGGDAAKIVESELISGVAMGRSLQQTARAISEAVGGHYDRAMLITRTETLRAYRGAQQEVYKQNEHLLEGWIWHASLTTRTCASCWAMHGTLHKVTETMSEHPAGRCSMIPRTKSWKDLGYDVPDARPNIEPGVDVFNRLNPEQQQKILTPKAYKAFRDGSIELRDLVNVRQSKTWGTTRSVGSVEGALSRAAKRVEVVKPIAKTFTPAKTLKEAQAFAESMGLKANYKMSGPRPNERQKQAALHAANGLNEAMTRLSQRGVPLPEKIAVVRDPYTSNALAYFEPDTKRIVGNSIHNLWLNPKRGLADQLAADWMVANDTADVLVHEAGHFLHNKSVTAFDMETTLLPGEERIARTISRYAATNRGEFVAEVFVKMMRGDKLSDDVRRQYRIFGGYDLG